MGCLYIIVFDTQWKLKMDRIHLWTVALCHLFILFSLYVSPVCIHNANSSFYEPRLFHSITLSCVVWKWVSVFSISHSFASIWLKTVLGIEFHLIFSSNHVEIDLLDMLWHQSMSIRHIYWRSFISIIYHHVTQNYGIWTFNSFKWICALEPKSSGFFTL